MLQTLNTYSNLYFNPIKIPAFTIVEFYKDSITQVNSLGYVIIPIEGLTEDEIENEIVSKADSVEPSGYSNHVILGGRNYNSYDHRIVYFVWYNGDTEPTFPPKPSILVPAAAADFNRYNTISVYNEGAAPCDVKITLTLVKRGEVRVMINNQSFVVNVQNVPSLTNTLVISKEGVLLNGVPYDDFTFSCTPTLEKGENIIGISKDSVTKIHLDYNPKF